MRYIVLLFMLFACQTVSKVNPGLTDILYEGYRTFETPRTGEKPGSIYRMPKADFAARIVFDTLNTNGKVIVTEEEFILKKYAIKKEKVLSLFGLGNGIRFKGNIDKYVEIYLGSAVKEEVLGKELNSLLKDNSFQADEDYKYYVVSATVSVDTIAIKFINKRNTEVEDSIDVKKFQARGYSKFYRGDTVIMAQKLPKLMRILYRPLPIKKNGLALDEEYKYEVGLPDSTFYIKD